MRLRTLGAVVALAALTATPTHGQLCPPPGCRLVCQPEADTFMAYESDTRSAGIFRGIVSPAQVTCAVDTEIREIPRVPAPTLLAPVTLTLPGGGVLTFLLRQVVQRWISVGGQFGGGACFTIEARAFQTPAGSFMVTDGCGTHTLTIQAPRFLCVTPTVRFLCFGMRNLDPVPPLPPGFERAENVCLVLH